MSYLYAGCVVIGRMVGIGKDGNSCKEISGGPKWHVGRAFAGYGRLECRESVSGPTSVVWGEHREKRRAREGCIVEWVRPRLRR